MRLIASVLALLTGVGAAAQNAEDAPAAAPPAPTTSTIPFVLTESNNISVQVVVNDTETLALMFHTGVDPVSLTQRATAGMTSLTMDQSASVKSWGGETSARHSDGNSLRIGELTWDDISITEGALSGAGTDGKFGLHLFGDSVVEIDFDASVLRIHSSLPELDPGFEKLPLVLENGMMFLTGRIDVGGVVYENEFMIHSGFGGTVLLDDAFVATHELGAKLETIGESELKDSYGNIVKTRKVVLPALRFGGATFSDVPTGLFEGKVGARTMSVVGGDVLKRFHILIDRADASIYVKPNRHFDSAFS